MRVFAAIPWGPSALIGAAGACGALGPPSQVGNDADSRSDCAGMWSEASPARYGDPVRAPPAYGGEAAAPAMPPAPVMAAGPAPNGDDPPDPDAGAPYSAGAESSACPDARSHSGSAASSNNAAADIAPAGFGPIPGAGVPAPNPLPIAHGAPGAFAPNCPPCAGHAGGGVADGWPPGFHAPPASGGPPPAPDVNQLGSASSLKSEPAENAPWRGAAARGGIDPGGRAADPPSRDACVSARSARSQGGRLPPSGSSITPPGADITSGAPHRGQTEVPSGEICPQRVQVVTGNLTFAVTLWRRPHARTALKSPARRTRAWGKGCFRGGSETVRTVPSVSPRLADDNRASPKHTSRPPARCDHHPATLRL